MKLRALFEDSFDKYFSNPKYHPLFHGDNKDLVKKLVLDTYGDDRDIEKKNSDKIIKELVDKYSISPNAAEAYLYAAHEELGFE